MAAKKSFTAQNPALMYISMPGEPQPKTEDTDYTDNTHPTHVIQLPDTQPTQHTQHTEYTHTQPTHKTYMESKSKRLNLLIRPSLHLQAIKIAHMQQTSVNDIINLALEQYIATHKSDITRYDQLFEPRG